MRRLALALLLTLAAPSTALAVSSTHMTLDRATAKDRKFEAWDFGVAPRKIHVACRRGPRGNFGCDFRVCVDISSQPTHPTSGITVTFDFGRRWIRAHDAIVGGRIYAGQTLFVGKHC